MKSKPQNTLKKTTRKYFNAPETFLFSKGRVGLYATLKALNIQNGDKIILPGYTCMVVPNAVQYLGANPIS